jgi:prepilin-type N-terminal cleavage/methylation domain-containing protein
LPFSLQFIPSQTDLQLSMNQKGFTLIELIIVLTISAILFSIVGSLSVAAFPRTQLSIESAIVLQTVRRAQSKAITGTKDETWGVKFNASQMVLFAGDTYAARVTALDQAHSFPEDLVLSGLTEVLFSARTGTPSTTGDIVLTQGSTGKTITLNLNAAGKIE